MYAVNTTVRKAVGAAPAGMCVGISDFASQEIRSIACIANISKYIDAYFEAEVNNPTLIRPDTKAQYINPKSDTHVLSAKAMYPELNDVPDWDLIKEAKKDMGGWDRRTRGKICSFT